MQKESTHEIASWQSTFLHTCTDAVLVVIDRFSYAFDLDPTYLCGFTLPKLYHTSEMGKVQENANQSDMFHQPCISEEFLESQFVQRSIRLKQTRT